MQKLKFQNPRKNRRNTKNHIRALLGDELEMSSGQEKTDRSPSKTDFVAPSYDERTVFKLIRTPDFVPRYVWATDHMSTVQHKKLPS